MDEQTNVRMLSYQMTTISRLASFSLDHKLCRKLMGNTKAALPSISSTSRTKNNHRASPKYVFCSTLAHVSYHITLNPDVDHTIQMQVKC